MAGLIVLVTGVTRFIGSRSPVGSPSIRLSIG